MAFFFHRSIPAQPAFIARAKNWWSRQNGNLRGGLLALAAGMFLALMVLLVKITGKRLPVVEILLFRQIFMGLVAGPAIYRAFPGVFKSGRPALQAVRILSAATAMVTGFAALQHLQLAEITAISYSRAFFITILAIFVLGETVGLRRWLAVLAGFAGVLVMIMPKAEAGFSFDMWSLVALASAFFVAVAVVSIRVLTRTDAPLTILSFQVVFVGLLMLAPTLFVWVTPTFDEWLLLIALGAVSVGGQLCNINAFKVGEAAVVAAIDYMKLIYVSVLGFLVFAEIPSLTTIAGAALVVAASLFTLWREKNGPAVDVH